MVPTRTVLRAGVEERFGEEGRGGFAVGSGDAGRGELALGMTEECGGRLGEGAAAMFDIENRQAGLIDGEMVEGLRGIGDDAERTGGERLVDVAVAVGRSAFHGDEDGAGAHRRESYSMPVMDAAELPLEPMAVISAIRSFQFISCLIVDVRSQKIDPIVELRRKTHRPTSKQYFLSIASRKSRAG
jgi:hypothetical protein